MIAAKLCTSDRAIRKKSSAAVVTTVTQHYPSLLAIALSLSRAAASCEHSRSVPIATPISPRIVSHRRRLPLACPAPHPR